MPCAAFIINGRASDASLFLLETLRQAHVRDDCDPFQFTFIRVEPKLGDAGLWHMQFTRHVAATTKRVHEVSN